MSTNLLTAKETIGQRIHRLRRENRISQKSLAKGIITDTYLSHLERDFRYPSVEVIRKLAKKLNVTPLFLETGQEDFCPHCLNKAGHNG